MDANNKEERPLNPRSKANLFEIITFSWILKLVQKGLKKELDVIDLYTILDEDSSALLGSKLEKIWSKEQRTATRKNKKPSFLNALFQMFGSKLIIHGIYLAITDMVFSIIQTIFVGKIISHFETKNTKNQFNIVVYYAVGLIIACSLKTFSSNSYNMMSSHLAMKMRVATCDLIYNKALRLKTNSLETTTGRIVNLMSNDVIRFDLTIVYIGYIFIGPIETIMVTYFLWKEVGVASILGVATFIIFIPLQVWLGSIVSNYRLKTANRTDARVNLMNEIISGIQVIKMYTWEHFFTKLIEFARKKEIDQITKTAYIKATLLSFSVFNTRLALFLSVLLYVVLGNYITASKVFIITSYYNILRVSMAVTFPVGMGLIAELLVSIKRIEDFLLREEKDERSITQMKTKNGFENAKLNDGNTVSNNIINQDGTEQSNDFCIVVSNVTAKWTESQNDNTLENINLTVKHGHLIAIIGPVGAGKSSLIQAILRELTLSKGSILVHGVVSYASQQPWLFAGSVQRNILFGLPMDRKRYNKVIEVCALKIDIEQFPYGDKTIVGERGISLSGGQRARINLARAIYKDADVYLLDDPLSAVDNHVGKHLFSKCIIEFLKEKTCILITHQLQYLTNVDQIILMENGEKIAEDSYKNLQESEFNFTKMLGSPVEPIITNDNETITIGTRPNFRSQNSMYTRQVSVLSVTSTVEESNYNDVQVEVVEVVEPIELAETRSFGNSGFSIYSSYFSAGGHKCKIILFLLICIFTQVLSSSGDYWITYWINLEEHVFFSIDHLESNNNRSLTNNPSNTLIPWIVSRNTCIIVFTVITLSIIISTLIRSALFVSVCTTSSTNLHNRMLGSIIRATMYFFNKNASGRILNRFSKDLGSIDEMLPFVLMDVIQIGLIVIGILIIVGITNPYFIIPTLIIVFIFFKIRNIYMTISQSIKRLEGVTRSPVFTHLNASLQGITTIRAFEAEEILSTEFSIHQDLHSSAWYLFISSSRAFGFWLDLTCLIYISIVTFCLLFISNDTYSGNVGLAITQSIGLIGLFQWGMRRSVELENQMTSVERVLEYTTLPQEPALESPHYKKPPKKWPNKGRITFNNFYLRYAIDTPYVLSNLNINIEPMEKIGIVGRTGAGKSSLIGALFRLALNEGNIIIDNFEIHEMGLHELRSKLTFIPQEPVLFSGTIRNNLDLYDEYSDHEIWSALNEVELKDVVDDLPNGLNSKMSDGGSNFSVGQRQLICLARAILQNNKILVLDEVTANVDHRTDALIQNTIRNKFQMCTVLTIAHRLNTVIDSDKILVLNGGTVVEFDHPYRLLKNTNGFFYKMVKQTDHATARLLHKRTAENYKNIDIRRTNPQ
ncbi:ATP-binding cassette sub-family C member 4-like isoform X2 [Rhopalosiphum padi]|uniref:ATP-binding cassette sub-family C member 4-like isoform X2 n=1 Tax=Rhopalosiphum padi TaxID=40932 RepID=UPI00298DD7C2|nr:ATP-binding cassette sub-family C member 4-like isoform X2 [Rhopalosiphum padi]